MAMLAYRDAQILDVVGPLEVFSRTSRWLRETGRRPDDAYSIELIGTKRGAIRTSSGMRLTADRPYSDVRGEIDTLLVAGGIGASAVLKNRELLRWLRRISKRVNRLASVCTGAFLLAEAGLLDGRRATTHWAYCERLAGAFPDVRVDPDRIYVRDGSVYTSAGVTAGMDMALALVEEDQGREVALEVARQLVLFLRRPGGQAQFSTQLAHQMAHREPLRELQSHIFDHPEDDLSVASMSHRVSMSPRNFARAFTREIGVTPAKFVEAARVDAARRLLEDTTDGLQEISFACGLGTPESLRRAFLRTLGVPPHAYRERFARDQEVT
jgi:transcriptional regulator GlxA family with amidase domain